MNALDTLIPTPRLLELSEVDLALPLERAWQVVRHLDLARSPLVRALFAVRTLPDVLTGHKHEALRLGIDALVSTPEQPGFQLLVDNAPHELAVAAIGKVWQLEIPFVHVPDATSYLGFVQPDYVKVAWAIRLEPRGAEDTHVTFELRVDATDDASWHKFQTYFLLIGPGSRFIRWWLLRELAREYGTPESREDERPLGGDELLPDAIAQVTDGITIAASPEAIWPWLVQMGCGRAGFYSYDLLDNGGRRSARELDPTLQTLSVGQVIPATPNSQEGFEVLRIEPARTLVLGGLFDGTAQRQLPFAAPRPEKFWHVTWSFSLEPAGASQTRLRVRARASCSKDGRTHLALIRPVHHFMERAQLRRLAARVEGRQAHDDLRDVAEGVSGAARMAWGLLTPFLRADRSHWGLSAEEAARSYPGDTLLSDPLWSWTHAVEIAASSDEVWPWLAQIGANRAAFYSYQWLENLAGCNLRNAEAIHPEWEVREGEELKLHPEMAGLKVVSVERGRHFIAHGAPDERAKAAGEAWVAGSWLFLIEPLGAARCRVISRYRAACSPDLKTRLAFGPTLVEPIGFAMDRRMLLGIKQRAEAKSQGSPTRSG